METSKGITLTVTFETIGIIWPKMGTTCYDFEKSCILQKTIVLICFRYNSCSLFDLYHTLLSTVALYPKKYSIQNGRHFHIILKND